MANIIDKYWHCHVRHHYWGVRVQLPWLLVWAWGPLEMGGRPAACARVERAPCRATAWDVLVYPQKYY
jgi:hypothetical protein